MRSVPQAVFNIKAFAMSENQKPDGYDASIYYTPEANTQNAQLIMSQVGEDTNWKMCVDTIVHAHAEAKVDTLHTHTGREYLKSYLDLHTYFILSSLEFDPM